MPALAASVALVLAGGWAFRSHSTGDYTIRTAAGESRSFALGDGTRIMLNGSTEIALNRDDPRQAALLSGEAQFTVHHDPVHPFTLIVGDRTLEDVGTVFNVRTSGTAMQVEVAQGAVRYEAGETRVRLDAGDTLSAKDDGIVTGHRATAEIGGWTRGRLVYHDRPLIEVAADITRSRGMAIELAPDLAAQPFTGVIQLDGDDATLQKRLESLLGLKVTSTADGWTIAK
ncbi:FecR family protein [Novosphingobium sp. 9]|uniref:FecR family protein n=1 Tax=Novosphingobium sp. 9 TaxID=2025349 RepID=UPI0021B4E7E8|nr:FecR domain-containing protein [Novosphingobium sp. 9]